MLSFRQPESKHISPPSRVGGADNVSLAALLTNVWVKSEWARGRDKGKYNSLPLSGLAGTLATANLY